MAHLKLPRIIHVGLTHEPHIGKIYVLLRQMQPNHFVWFKEIAPGQEEETSISADTMEEAVRLARKEWRNNSFRTVNCGFRYTLPERDEHGYNAYFYEMLLSYRASNGIYFDEELGHNCIVNFASNEALELGKRLFN